MPRFKAWPGDKDGLFLDSGQVAAELSRLTGQGISDNNVRYWVKTYPVEYPERPQPPAPVLTVLAGMPAGVGSPRWEREQMPAWHAWYESVPHESFTPGNQLAAIPVTEEQQAEFERVLAEAEAEGRKPRLQDVQDATGLGYRRARNLMIEAGVLHWTPDDELVDQVRELIDEHGPELRASHVGEQLGTRWDRTLKLIELAGGIPPQQFDLSRLVPVRDGRVPVKAITATYGVDPSVVSRMRSHGQFPSAVKDGREVWIDRDEVITVMGERMRRKGARKDQQ